MLNSLEEMLSDMQVRAEEAGVDTTEFTERIAKARIRMHLDITVCPCAAQDPDRGCISAKCLREIKEKGTCHCCCYRRKDD